jgi:phosphatidylglycerophosphate synthase
MVNLPVLLTSVRLLAGPLYFVMGSETGSWLQFSCLAIAAATDILDGPLARRLGITSSFGAALDATADKVLVLSVLMKHAMNAVLPLWIFWAFAAQYVFIAVEGLIYLRKYGVTPVPHPAARISAAIAVAAVLTVVAVGYHRATVPLVVLAVTLNTWHMAAAFVRDTAERRAPPPTLD